MKRGTGSSADHGLEPEGIPTSVLSSLWNYFCETRKPSDSFQSVAGASPKFTRATEEGNALQHQHAGPQQRDSVVPSPRVAFVTENSVSPRGTLGRHSQGRCWLQRSLASLPATLWLTLVR